MNICRCIKIEYNDTCTYTFQYTKAILQFYCFFHTPGSESVPVFQLRILKATEYGSDTDPNPNHRWLHPWLKGYHVPAEEQRGQLQPGEWGRCNGGGEILTTTTRQQPTKLWYRQVVQSSLTSLFHQPIVSYRLNNLSSLHPPSFQISIPSW